MHFSASLSAATFTVGPGGTYATLQAAVDAAVSAGGENEILIRSGTYFQTVVLGDDFDGQLTISGGWGAAFNAQVADPALTVFTGDRTARILDINITSGMVRFENLSLVNGFHPQMGGGLQLTASGSSVVEFESCLFVQNRAGLPTGESNFAFGSAVHAELEEASRLVINHCGFRQNVSSAIVSATGAIQVVLLDFNSTTLEVKNSEFMRNETLTRLGEASGAALHLTVNGSSQVTVEGNDFNGNSCESSVGLSRGGAMLLDVSDNASFQIRENLFTSQRIRSDQETRGAALAISASDTVQGVLDDNSFVDNRFTGQGNGSGHALRLFTRNDSHVEAGRNIWLDNGGPPYAGSQVDLTVRGTMSLHDSLIAGGTGGISGSGANLFLTNLTIAFNQGVGLDMEGPHLDNSIVFGNEVDMSDPDGIEGDANLVGRDPFFSDPVNDDFRVIAGSVAINGGNNVPPAGLGSLDLDGEDRLFGSRVDVGAYEFNQVENTQYLTQIGDGRADTIVLNTQVNVANTASGESQAFQIDFFDSQGTPISTFSHSPSFLLATTTGISFAVRLSPGETWTYQTPGEGPIQGGYARIRGGQKIGVTGIFSRLHEPTQTVLYQAGVPASAPQNAATLFVDSLGPLETGLAIVNVSDRQDFPLSDTSLSEVETTGASAGEVSLQLYDEDFQLLAQTVLDLPAGTHQASFVSQLFSDLDEAGEMRGILTVESGDPFSLVTLRQNDRPGVDFPAEVPTLAAFPVLEGVPARNAPAGGGAEAVRFYYPQIGNGQVGAIGLQTSASVLNLSGTTRSVAVDFYGSDGSPLTLTLLEMGTDSSFLFDLAPGESRVLTTDGQGTLQVGYASVSTQEGVQGSAVFSRNDLPTGIVETESGVPASFPAQEFSLFVDTSGEADTGLALVYPSTGLAGAAALLELRLFDGEGQQIASREISLGPGQHTAQFITQIFSDVDGIDEMQGLLAVSSPVGIAAVTLLQGDDPDLTFPDDVGTLTAFPVLPGAP